MKINRKAFVLSLLTAVAFMVPGSCGAVANIGTWSFLQGTPAETFNKQDWSIFESTMTDTLNTAQDEETKTWQNPKTKTSGEIKVLRTVNNSAHDCRLLKITNNAQGNSNELELIFCKQPDGKWKIATPKVK
ncbi:MAG: RT0821/Lpp0805 family surface protein [Candidatus Methylumidiphilus sp.]